MQNGPTSTGGQAGELDNVIAFRADSLGARLRQRRQDSAMTQADLAQTLGVRRAQTIAAWEQGESPQRRFHEAIASFLDLEGASAVRRLLAPTPLVTKTELGEAGPADPNARPLSPQIQVALAIAAQLESGRQPTEADRRLYVGMLRAVGVTL
jgi:DNA-binding XRE family transcriptional regulator